jgi:hypothetical protein
MKDENQIKELNSESTEPSQSETDYLISMFLGMSVSGLLDDLGIEFIDDLFFDFESDL